METIPFEMLSAVADREEKREGETEGLERSGVHAAREETQTACGVTVTHLPQLLHLSLPCAG